MTGSREALRELLIKDLQLLNQSVEVLKISLERSNKIGIKAKYNNDELIDFESLTSRYARTADILTQKILKTLFMYMQEEAKYFIDRCNLSEKLGLVDKADILYNIRKLRNDIAHEYCITDVSTLFDDVLIYSKELLIVFEKINNYIRVNIG